MKKQIRNLALILNLAFLPACANLHSNRVFSVHESERVLYHWEIPRAIAIQKVFPNNLSPSQKYVQDFKSQFENPYIERDMDLNKDYKITLKEQERFMR